MFDSELGSPPKRIQSARIASWRIFVVDDEPNIASTLAAILRIAGYESDYFVNPQSALEALRLDTPDLLISDVCMPGMNGVELGMAVRERHPECDVLLFSGQAETGDLLKIAREAGYDFPLMSKPVHPIRLLAQISNMERDSKAKIKKHQRNQGNLEEVPTA